MASFHLMGICGTGMGSFAGLLKAAGHDVRGSDQNVYPPMSDKLAAWGIEVRKGYGPKNLEPAVDTVIVGNVIPRKNPEAQAMVEQGLRHASFPETLGAMFLKERHSVVVSGTHGKTTTTSMIAWLLASAGRNPGMLVGGIPGNFDEGFRVGGGEHFVVEGDEYDTAYWDKVPKFVHYFPKTLLMTSLEFDHADIYDSVEAIEDAFDRVVALVPADGQIIACASAPRVMARLDAPNAKVVTYSARSGTSANWTVREVETRSDGTRFSVLENGASVGRFFLPMSGLHNVENALAAVAFARSQGVTIDQLTVGLASFEGIARRQTVRAVVDGVRVIDDFAHHPTAVRETTDAIRARYADGRVFAIFEPRTATSSRAYFQEAYTSAFDAADEVVIAGVGRKEIDASERLDIARLATDVTERGTRARSIADVDAIVALLAEEARSGDTLLFMSNGGFGGIYDKIEAALVHRQAQNRP